MKNYSKSLSIIITGIFVLLCFCACVSEPEKQKVEASNPETAKKVAIGDLPVTENTTVKVHLFGDPTGLSPYVGYNAYKTIVVENFFPTLVHIDPEKAELVPVLAKTLPIVDEISTGAFAGMRRYTFEIHEEAVWDNGSPVLASDYEFTIKTCLVPGVKTPYTSYFKLFKEFKIDAKNPKKFSAVIEPHILGEEIVGGVYFYPEYVYDADKLLRKYTIMGLIEKNKDKEWATKAWKKEPGLQKMANDFNSPKYTKDPAVVSSCGAYKLKEYIPGQKMSLVKKENWWGDKLRDKNSMLTAIPKNLEYRVMADMATALTALKGGELDLMSAIEPNAFKDLEKSHADQFNFFSPELIDHYYLNINMLSPKLSDKRTRKALAHLFDLDRAKKALLNNLATRITNPIHPSRPYYNKSLKLIDYNPEKAKQLLAEAGWGDSDNNGVLDQVINGKTIDFEIDIVYGIGGAVGESFLILLKEAAGQQGIVVNLVGKDYPGLVAAWKERAFDMSISRAQGLPILDDLTTRWHSSGPNNFSGFGNPESDKLIEDIRICLDKDKRDKMYMRMQEIIYDEQPAIFLFAPKERIAINNKFKHVVTSIRKPGYFETRFATKTGQ